MSSVQKTGETNDGTSRPMELFVTVKNSVTLCLATLGIILFVAGFLINTGIWAAMYAVWGAALFFAGVIGYTFIWWQRR